MSLPYQQYRPASHGYHGQSRPTGNMTNVAVSSARPYAVPLQELTVPSTTLPTLLPLPATFSAHGAAFGVRTMKLGIKTELCLTPRDPKPPKPLGQEFVNVLATNHNREVLTHAQMRNQMQLDTNIDRRFYWNIAWSGASAEGSASCKLCPNFQEHLRVRGPLIAD